MRIIKHYSLPEGYILHLGLPRTRDMQGTEISRQAGQLKPATKGSGERLDTDRTDWWALTLVSQ